MPVQIRDYVAADEQAWLRCRVLSFLGSAYFDDVMYSRPPGPAIGAGLVAVESGKLIGLLDVEVDGALATISTIAVHPDHQREGLGTVLLETARARAEALGATVIDAWTRDDEPALNWYRSRGFAEGAHYLHVYADIYAGAAEPPAAVQARPGMQPVKVFLHVTLDREAEMRAKFRRVHVCRRFARQLGAKSPESP